MFRFGKNDGILKSIKNKRATVKPPATEVKKMNTDKIYAVSIANEYAAKDARKVIQLKKLDKKAKTPANVFTYSFGIIAALVVGVGICLSMKVIGDESTAMTVLGIAVGVLGFVLAGINYPIYKKYVKTAKRNMPRTL